MSNMSKEFNTSEENVIHLVLFSCFLFVKFGDKFQILQTFLALFVIV